MRIGLILGDETRSFDELSGWFDRAGHIAVQLPASRITAMLSLQLEALLLHDGDTSDAGGVELCRRLRAFGSAAAILVVASRFDPEQARRAFSAGCDDYFVEPVSPEALLNRLQILVIRQQTLPAPAATDLTLGPLRIDPFDRVLVGDRLHRVPSKEIALLRCLASTPGELVRFEQLVAAAWGDMRLGSNSLEVHMSRLRRWLTRTLGPGVIEIRAVRGAGYLLATG